MFTDPPVCFLCGGADPSASPKPASGYAPLIEGGGGARVLPAAARPGAPPGAAPLLAAHAKCYALYQAHAVLLHGKPAAPPAGAWALDWRASLAEVAPPHVVAAVEAAAAAGAGDAAAPPPSAAAKALAKLAAVGYQAFVDVVCGHAVTK